MEQEGIMAKICFVAVILLAATTSVKAQATENNEQCTGESHEITFEAYNEEELRKKLEDIFTPILINNPNAELSISSGFDRNGANNPSVSFSTENEATDIATTDPITTENQESPSDFSNATSANTSLATATVDPSTVIGEDTLSTADLPEACGGVIYNQTCYEAIIRDRSVYYPSGAKSACKAKGWEIADIYDASHYDIIVNYILEEILVPPFFTKIYLWTGMTYKENQVVLSTGRNITLPDRVWCSDCPHKNDASFFHIRIWVDYSPVIAFGGLQNWRDVRIRGVLCRIP
ncbi:uncharacterized protein LOC120334972 [Styela clava]